MHTDLKIAIIGAGPAGCLLARLLHQGGVEATVFEGDASPDFRSQGGSLDLHTDTGIAALKDADLFEKFQQCARYDGQYMAMVDKDLRYYFVRQPKDKQGTLGERPEIDRHELREILANSLPEGMIRWGHRLLKIDDGMLVFENTSIGGFDLVVGADGVWSKVRKFIYPKLEPSYTGVALQEFRIPEAEATVPELCKLVNRGSVFASSDGQRLSVQQMGDGSLNVYASYVRKDPKWIDTCGYDPRDLEQAKKAVLEEYADWCPELRNAVSSAKGKTTPRPLWILPPGARWQHEPGFTLIGDAAHAMTPHAGEGVNQALADALHLSRAILRSAVTGAELSEQIRAFEEAMFARAGKIQQLSYDMTQYWMFTQGAPKAVMPKVISRFVNDRLPWVLRPISTMGVYLYFFFKNILG